MLPNTCLSCHVKNNGMIAIHQHPNGLDDMFLSITGIEVEPNDHLCVPCYDDLKSAHHFKQRCIQNNVVRLSGQASKAAVPATVEQTANSSADVSTTCDETRPVPETVKSTSTTHQPEEEHVEAEDEKREEPREEVATAEAEDPKDGDPPVEYVIDLEMDSGAEQQLESDKKEEEEYPLVQVESDEENNHDSATGDKSSHELVEEENEAPKTSPRLPKVHSLMCEFCFKEFPSLADKIDHTETHRTEQKPFKCFHDGCSSSFKDRVGLRAHVRIHAAVKRFGCRYCTMRFHTRGNRNAHERTHNGEKPFLCPTCGKGFAEGGNLKNHIRFHNGERPYPCTMCDKSYRTHYSRSVHMRSHTNERPFVCDDCGKGFYSTGKLTIHRRIHTGERPYGCGSCDARFIDRCGLRRHQIKAHWSGDRETGFVSEPQN